MREHQRLLAAVWLCRLTLVRLSQASGQSRPLGAQPVCRGDVQGYHELDPREYPAVKLWPFSLSAGPRPLSRDTCYAQFVFIALTLQVFSLHLLLC